MELKKRTWQNSLGLWVTARDGGKDVMRRHERGDVIELAPHCELWMRGAKHARIVRFYTSENVIVRVRPIVAGVEQRRIYSIRQDHILANRGLADAPVSDSK